MRWTFLALFISIFSCAFGQVLVVESRDNFSWLNSNPVSCRTSDCREELDNLDTELKLRGYLLYDIQKSWDRDTLTVTITAGQPFTFGTLTFKNIPESLIPTGGPGARLNYNWLNSFYSEVLRFYEDRGFPYAKVQMDSISMMGQEISGRINAEPGERVSFYSIEEKKGQLRSGWLQRYLGIEAGQDYNQSKVAAIPAQLQKLGFYLAEDPLVNFTEAGAEIVISLDPSQGGSFDAFIGLQQHPITEKLILAGYADLAIQNLFRTGKQLQLHWERIRAESQELDLSYTHSGLFTNGSLEYNFNLIRIDTSFLTVKNELTLIYSTKAVELMLGGNLRSGNVINYTQEGLNSADQSLSLALLGMSLNFERSSGYIRSEIGTKDIRGTSEIPPSLYDGTGERIFIGYFTGGFNVDLPFGRFIWNQKVDGGLLVTDVPIFNDQFFLGGINSIRGFNERSIYGDAFAIWKSELKFMLEKGSYLSVFTDLARVDPFSETAESKYLGFGAGMNFNMGTSSRLNVFLAWGKTGSSAIDFSDTKIHVGYLSKF